MNGIPLISYVFSIAAATLMLAVIITLLLKKRLRERHALWWLFIGILALLAAIFPSLLEGTARVLGIMLPISLVFFVGIVVLFIASVQHSAELTQLEEKSRTLAEHYALLEKRVRELETTSARPAIEGKDHYSPREDGETEQTLDENPGL